jgi:prepilin-type N-terminal cleavage/methylation domain-containing protein/prepilin-type processing-associated H-X9-DG protein
VRNKYAYIFEFLRALIVNNKMTAPRRGNKRSTGFTLIELLIVIAIIALLAATLFPVFSRVRERARVSVCTSNMKQFSNAILMYAQDNDDGMPLAWKTPAGIGIKAAADLGKTPQGMWLILQPYVKSTDIFKCPDDALTQEVSVGKNTPNTTTITAGTYKYFDAFGQSYKFVKENFTMTTGMVTAQYGGIKSSDIAATGCDDCIAPFNKTTTPSSGTFVAPPVVITLAFFARPSETRLMRDTNPPFDLENPSEQPFHPQGMNVAFVDGHVKFIVDSGQADRYCNGPTASPSRAQDPAHAFTSGDGSCNTMGVERKKW